MPVPTLDQRDPVTALPSRPARPLHRLRRRRVLQALSAASAIGVLGLSGAAAAQSSTDWPTRPVRLVIGFTPGGGIDTLARLLAPKLSERFKQQFIVENKPGANGVVATQTVASSAPDGHTVLIGTTGNLSVNPVFIAHPPFNMDRDFVPVTQLVSLAFLLMSDPALPAADLNSFIGYAKSRPGKISFSSSGTGGLPHLAAQLFSDQTGIGAVHVPYKGSAPALADVMGSQVQYVVDAPAIGLPHVRGGKLKALATTGAKRLDMMPDVPTVAETVPGFEVVNWYGVVVPTGTPASAIQSLQVALKEAMADPDIATKMRDLGLDPVGSTPTEFGRFMKAESERWGKVIRDAKIKPE